jgi:four helix bundle protein
MPTFQSFEEIEAWQKARELTREVYAISDEGPFARDFGLRDQMRRASVSALSNIAEGFERSGTGEFVQFLSAAKDRRARSELSSTSHSIEITLTLTSFRNCRLWQLK